MAQIKNARMELARRIIEKWGGEALYSEAERKVREGAVLKAWHSGEKVSGLYRSPVRDIKTSFTVRSGGMVLSDCPCDANRKSGLVCIHVVAVAIYLMERLNDPAKRQRQIEEERHARRMENAPSRLARSPKGTPSEILLKVPSALYGQFESGNIELGLLFLSGGRALLPENVPPGAVLSFTEEDNTAIDVLEDITEGKLSSRIVLERLDFLSLLDVCRGRVLASGDGGQVLVESKAESPFVSAAIQCDTGELKLEISFSGAGAGAKCLAALERSYALSGDRLVPLKRTLPEQYHSLYREPVFIEPKSIMPFLRTEYPVISKTMPIRFEGGISVDSFSLVPGNPSFELTVSGSPQRIAAVLDAIYGQKRIPAFAPAADGLVAEPDPDDFLRFFGRNTEKEKEALEKLAPFGFSGSNGAGLCPVEGQREILNVLGGLLPRLRREGWRVKTEGRIGRYYDTVMSAIPVVGIGDEQGRSNCFCVKIDYDDGSGGNLPHSAIQTAINKNQFFAICGGKTLLLDIDAIERLRKIFIDCKSTPGKTPGAFVLSGIYAPYVMTALESIDGIDISVSGKIAASLAPDKKGPSPRAVGKTESFGRLDGILRPYQKEGVSWMRLMEKKGFPCILADEMGLGKTIQTLAWISLERIDPKARNLPSIIVAPTSLIENWHREAQRFTPWLKTVVMHGTMRHSNWETLRSFDIVITSYALLRRDLDSYCSMEFAVAVLDEAQQIKNRQAQNSIAAKRICASCRMVLSGTPIENGLSDVWSIMDFLMPHYLGDFGQFRQNYMLPLSSGEGDTEEILHRLSLRLKPFLLRRLKRDVAKDLPEKIVKISYSRMTAEQAEIYERLRGRFREKIRSIISEKGLEKSRMDVLALLLRLRQAACDAQLLPPELSPECSGGEPSGKTAQFMEIVREAISGGHRILVFSQFVKMLSILGRHLDMEGIPYCYLDGSTENRLEECQRFNNSPQIPLFLISLKAGGTGLNLTGADMVVHFDPWWNPAIENQATDRAHRIGQKRKVCAIKLISEGTIEERVLEMQRKKQKIISSTIGGGDAAMMGSLTKEEIEELLR